MEELHASRDVIGRTRDLLFHWSEALLRNIPHPLAFDVSSYTRMDTFGLEQEISRAAGKCEASTVAAISGCLSNGPASSPDPETHYWLWRRCYCAHSFLRLLTDSSGLGFYFLELAPDIDPKTLAWHLLTDWWNCHGPRFLANELAAIQHDSDLGSPWVVD